MPRTRLSLLAGILVLALLPVGPGALAKESPLEKTAGKQKTKIAKVWLDLARYLEGRDLKAEAEDAIGKARALDPALKDLDEVAKRVAGLAGEGVMDASTQARIEKAKKGAAKGYDKLAGVFKNEKNDARFVTYLAKALELEPSKSRTSKLAGLAKKNLILLSSPEHPMVAYVSFPKAWKPGKTFPVLVGVDGAGADFLGCARRFQSSRGSRPFIVVSPHALSCTNEIKKEKFPAYDQALIDEWNGKRTAFDVPGLLAILDFLETYFGAAHEIAITGFSGGGNLCYSMVLQHPDRVFCAAPACANFLPQLASGAPQAEDGGPPVHLMTGEKDPHRYLTFGKTPPGIEEQTDWAEKALKEHGFEKVKRTMLPGVGHSALPREVWAFVDEVREGS